MNKLQFVLLVVSFLFGNQVYAADPAEKIQEMLDDLGGTAELELKNIGNVMKCKYRGTKMISVAIRGDVTTYIGSYSNCIEGLATRDGIYEIVVNGDDVLSNTEKRSINGKLFDAVIEDDFIKAKGLVRKHADVNYTESRQTSEGEIVDEWSPLMSAVVSGNLKMVKMLVQSGAWVNYMNSTACNAIWLAASTGNLHIVKYLASQGAYIENQNVNDMTPLMIAAASGYSDIVKFLIKSHAKLDIQHVDGDTALMLALSRGKTEIVNSLIDSGADVNIQNKFGVTALIIAVTENNPEITKKLIAKKANLTLKMLGGKTALDIATFRGHTQLVEMIKQAQ